MNTNSQSQRILGLLQAAGQAGVPNYQLAEVSLQYNARVYTLRHKDGYDIRKRRTFRNTFVYYLYHPMPVQKVISVRPQDMPENLVLQEIQQQLLEEPAAEKMSTMWFS